MVGALNSSVQEVQCLPLCLQMMMRMFELQAGRLAETRCLFSLIDCTF